MTTRQKDFPCANNRGTKFSSKKARRAAREEAAEQRRRAREAAQAVLKR
jgi:hypothetical protein